MLKKPKTLTTAYLTVKSPHADILRVTANEGHTISGIHLCMGKLTVYADDASIFDEAERGVKVVVEFPSRTDAKIGAKQIEELGFSVKIVE